MPVAKRGESSEMYVVALFIKYHVDSNIVIDYRNTVLE